MVLAAALAILLVTIFVFLLSGLPLFFAVRLLGGKTSVLKTALVVLVTGVIVSAIEFTFKTFGGILAFVVLIWIYHEVFRLKWWKAFILWFVHLAIIVIFRILAGVFLVALGISLL